MNYTIVQDRQILNEFIEWLPETKPNEKYYVSLLARRKYSVSNYMLQDKLSLKRFTSDKKRLFDKIRQLEIKYGNYRFGSEDLPVPQEALALYISPNPRDLEKASKSLIQELLKKTWSTEKGYNPHSMALSEIQKSNGSVVYFDFDFDGVTIDETLPKISEVINLDCCSLIETRGGFHVLVKISEIDSKFRKSWNPSISKLEGCDVRGTSGMIPVPGTTQGNFIPKLIRDL